MRPSCSRSRVRQACVALIAVFVAAGLTAAPGSAAAAGEDLPPAPGTVPVEGATIVGQQWLTKRTVQLTVATPSFTTPALVEVMLPTGYAADPDLRWPVTYYTHGTNGDQTTFRAAYNGEEETASYPSIVVAPAGHSGYWSDWHNGGEGGPPKYETFVIRQLLPLIDANFRTLPDRAHRAIVGESMGGYGALMLAARHPDLFTAASSLSGAVDSNWVGGAAALSVSPLIDTSPPDSVYGPRVTEEVRWRGHNPTDLATNLGALDLQLYTGNGVLGAREVTDPLGPYGCSLEAGIIKPETESLHNELVALGIPHVFAAYDWGCHTRAMFRQQIAETLPRFASRFAAASSAPTIFDYRSIEPQFSVFGWSVTADPDRALEFLDLKDVSASGFTITGSGLTRVTTPSLFRGARAVTVLINGVPSSVKPDATGRLLVVVDLGPAARDQQYTVGGTGNRRSSVVRFVRR